MAFTAAAAARHGGGRNSIMFMNNVPSIISKYHNQPADIDDPIAESEGEEHSKKDKKRDMTGDARLVNVVYSGLRTSEYCCAFFGLLGIGISIIEREQRWVYGLKDNTAIRVVLLSFNLLVTIFLLVSLYFSYKMMFNWMKARGLLGKYDDLINTGMYKSLLAEMFVCILSPLPFIPNETYNEYNNNFNVTIPQYYNDLLLAASFARIYLFIRCIVTNSYYMSTRAQRVCQMNGCYASYMFAIKCLMKDKAYLVLTTNLVLSMFYFGYG